MLITLKWLLICCLIGIFSGSASALFLVSLEFVTQVRIQNTWIIWLLPFGGLFIGYLYFISDSKIAKGNNLLLEEYNKPEKMIVELSAKDDQQLQEALRIIKDKGLYNSMLQPK